MDSIEVFDIASLEVMRLCISEFPVPVTLNADDIAITVQDFYPEGYFDNQSSGKLREICQHTIFWLNDENIISLKEIGFQRPQGTLTRDGLSLLNRVPNSISGSTFRDVISKGVASIPAALVSGVVAQLFGK
jgi:hypothetical protein